MNKCTWDDISSLATGIGEFCDIFQTYCYFFRRPNTCLFFSNAFWMCLLPVTWSRKLTNDCNSQLQITQKKTACSVVLLFFRQKPSGIYWTLYWKWNMSSVATRWWWWYSGSSLVYLTSMMPSISTQTPLSGFTGVFELTDWEVMVKPDQKWSERVEYFIHEVRREY